MTSTILATRGLAKHYGGLAALAGLDLAVQEGSVHSVIGPNGAGKTTLFDCITRYVEPSVGEVSLRGRSLGGLPPERVAAAGIGRTYQNIRLFRSLTVAENLLVGMHLVLGTSWWGAVLNTRVTRDQEARARDEARSLLEFIGLRGRGDAAACALSYGEQRRLEIGRALASKPAVLLLDEPTAGMNSDETSEMIEFIRALPTALSLTVVLIEHQMRVVMAVSDCVTVLVRGAKVAEGTPAQVRSDARVVEAYLGTGVGLERRSSRAESDRSGAQ
jgi:branched-chain amino acid transport system ATP-binding protein